MGERLLKDLTHATGLPNDLIDDELSRLLGRAGVEREAVTIEDLREVLSEYVQEVLLELKESGDLDMTNDALRSE